MAPRSHTKDKEMAEFVAMVITQVFSSEEFEIKLQTCIDRAFEKKMDEFLRQIEIHSGQIHDIEVSMEKTSTEMKNMQAKIASLEDKCEYSSNHLNQLEQYSRRNCLRVFGIEEHPNENTNVAVMDLTSKYLGFKLNPSDIDRSHRIGKKEQGKPRAIIIKFQNYNARDQCIKNRRKLKGTKFVIKEDLTKVNQQLLQATKINPLVKSAWSHDGKIVALVSKNNNQFTKKIWGLNDLQRL